jgi:hypothetical protein
MVAAGMMGNLAFLGVLAMLAGALAMLALILVAGMRGAWVLAKALPLYPAVFFIAVIAFAFISRKRPLPGFNKLAGLIAAAAICFFGFKGATSYYGNSARVFPSIYYADYVLEDTEVHERRNGKGNVAAQLAPGEKVTVNGISFNEQEFNVTTAAGVTGWVGREAFPEDAADMLAISIGLDGIDTEEIAVDRQTERLMQKYLAEDRELIVMDVPTKYYKMSPATLARSTTVGAAAPLLAVERKEYKNGAVPIPAGKDIVLEKILYADDCTLLYASVTETEDSRIWPLAAGGALNVPAWYKSLAATDLDTGQTYPLMQGDYRRAFWYDKAGQGYKSQIVFFFPPFKSRRFSLTHGDVSPLPDAKKTGFNGILGWMSSMTGQDRAEDYYFDWNFPEVNVK